MAATSVVHMHSKQRGVLLIAVLLILLVITLLGLSAMDATGLEMQMSSNNREQLVLAETAEYAVVQVAKEIQALEGFSANSLANRDCDELCFDKNCTGGYCFFGEAGDPSSWETCRTGLPITEPSQEAAIWADNSGRYKTINSPDANISTRYIIEFRCYTAVDESLEIGATNNTQVFRITALASNKSKRSRVMLRVTLKNL